MSPLKIRDIMTTEVTTIHLLETATSAAKLLVQRKVSGAPVVDDEGRMVGLVTELDLLLALDFLGRLAPVERVMRTEVTSVSPDADLDEVRRLFIERNFRRAPVVADGKLLGIVSRRDLMKAMLCDEPAPEDAPST